MPVIFQNAKGLLLALVLLHVPARAGEQFALRQVRPITEPGFARLVIHADRPASHRIPAYITGKFAEHLGNNIVNGMDAQILVNPTFAEYPFWNGEMTSDGVTKFITDDQEISRRFRGLANSRGWPDAALDDMNAARRDGLAALWTRIGTASQVRVSPDTGPYGGRAQRVEVSGSGQGIAQWAILPLHRVRKYKYELFARSPDLNALQIALAASGEERPCTSARVTGISSTWRSFKGELEVPAGLADDVGYQLALTGEGPGQFVVRHLLLRPADHVNGADPDVIRFLKASRLPLLRWPGGNFVSGYHWEDGVGPLERRPTRPNYAWGQIEPNFFGTDEFVAFCRAVGCEPMICINAGDGTPQEAARWVEYCNGSASTQMGKLRAANGQPAPYSIRHWEVGNELWGRWQVNWTTARGYVDRYKTFAPAMLKADPAIKLQACGAPVLWGKEWNDTLIAGAATEFSTLTDHPLIGGDVPANTDPLDVYRDFLAVPEVLEQKWAALREDMRRAGIREPRLAVTELQLFAHLARSDDAPARLTPQNLVRPSTLAEGIYDVLIYHAAVRLAPFVEMVTQSATVNHGGGLRKVRERVFAHPCHYAQTAFAALANAVPVACELECRIEQAPRVLPQLRDATPNVGYSSLDAVAALSDGNLLVSLVNRSAPGSLRVDVHCPGLQPDAEAELTTLSAAEPWAQNTPDNPKAVVPVSSRHKPAEGGILHIVLPAYGVSFLRIPMK
jgi:alpha-N-arabinofuranosidase